jgi:bacterial/archaeal transporter family-2 protein
MHLIDLEILPMNWLIVLSAMAAGAANPFQSGVNAELNKRLAQPLWATFIIYITGLCGLFVLQLVLREPPPVDKISTVPWWAWMGGLISIVSTIIGLTIAHRMGSGSFTGLSVTVSLIVSVLLDHFGLLGFRQHTASPARIAGCGLMVVGLWVITKF